MRKIRIIVKQKWFIFLSICFFIFLIYFYNQNQNTYQTTIKESTKVKKGTIKEELILSGEIDAKEKVTLRFQTSGRLAYVAVKEGDTVKKGQYIASLDTNELKKRLEKELNFFKSKRLDLDQKRKELENQPMTEALQKLLEKAQLDVDNAVIDVELQHIANNFAHLYSPIDGVITRINVKYPGVNITPAQAEFDIVNPSTAYLSLTADQNEVTKLKTGMKGKAFLDAFGETPLKGHIETIGITPKENETNTVYKVTFVFDTIPPQYQMRMGMTGEVTFILAQKKDALILPVNFVKGTQKPYVFVKKNGSLVKQKVKLGLESEKYFEIIQGVTEGTEVYD